MPRLDGITDSMDMSLRNLRELWWTGRPGVLRFMGSQSRTWLSEWTELNWGGSMWSGFGSGPGLSSSNPSFCLTDSCHHGLFAFPWKFPKLVSFLRVLVLNWYLCLKLYSPWPSNDCLSLTIQPTAPPRFLLPTCHSSSSCFTLYFLHNAITPWNFYLIFVHLFIVISSIIRVSCTQKSCLCYLSLEESRRVPAHSIPPKIVGQIQQISR